MSRILVVEDDPAVAFGLAELLKAENYDVVHFINGEEALVDADKTPPDLVLLDIALPGMNGYDVCRRLREANYVNPVIMLSARSQPVDRVVGLEVGADDYMTKPFNARELTARVSAHLRRAERLRAVHSPRGQRRHLLAVMFTDIAGYSRIMHEDEALGVRLLETHNSLMRIAIERFDGAVVEIIGDAFLARFESAVDAVSAAVHALHELALRNNGLAESEHIHVRIGIHLGDVLDYGDNLKGDTVNIAARIQQLAQPDTLCISDDVYNVITRKISYEFEDLGEQMLKNISNPLRVWKVRTP
jgi:DNA-binding response OmpR family regulator